MIRITVIILLLSLLSPAVAEDYAAKVNGKIISIERFEKVFAAAKKQLEQQEEIDFASEEGQVLLAATKYSILDELIDFALLNQGVKDLGIEVTEKEIKERVKKVQKGFPSKAVFSKALAEDGITIADLRQGIRQEILIEKLTIKLASKVKITDGDIVNFFNRNKELFSQPKRVQVFQMLLPTRKEAEEMAGKLKKGEKFRKLAKRYSLDQLTSVDGGELGFIEEAQLPPQIAAVVAKMKPEDISEPIEAEEGFYLIKCGEILNKREARLDSAKEQVRNFLVKEKELNIYDRWFEQYKNKASIEINQELFPKLKSSGKGKIFDPKTSDENNNAPSNPMGYKVKINTIT